ncbi:MAG TPA: class I adenylate-forming enzyme family protein [Burkholderiales bacterium]|nr:class I adenylate-forming enzyme family protein [Burkholderiales bacterium]
MTQAYNLGALYDAATCGDGTALIDVLDWENPRTYTHREIDGAANALARGMLKRGFARGDAVAILSVNRAEFVISFLGIVRAGLVAVPISHKFPRATIEYVLQHASVQHVMCDAARRALVPAGFSVTDFDEAGAFTALLDPGEFSAVRPRAGETAMILYTSGSTGVPKGVPLSHEGHLWATRSRMKRGAPFNTQRLLVAAPLCHMNGLCTTLFVMASGASEVLMPEFHARHFLQAIERFRCTWLTGVPPMYAMCLREQDLIEKTDRSTVATVRMGSAPISLKLWREVEATFPNALVMNSYGTTESGPVICGPRPDRKLPPTSIGWPFDDVELRLIDAQGRDADEGVLWQRTPANMSGYLNMPEKTREVLTADGWYISGDVFRRDADGAYFFVGRTDDMFVCGGENVFPGEVEHLLERHPDIVQACVVPVPDEIKGEKPFAFVVVKAGSKLTEDDVKRYALEHGPAYQHPRRICFVDALPLAGPNKVDRKGLKQKAAALWQVTA